MRSAAPKKSAPSSRNKAMCSKLLQNGAVVVSSVGEVIDYIKQQDGVERKA